LIGKKQFEKNSLIGTFFTIEEGSNGMKIIPKECSANSILIYDHEYAYIRPLNTKGKTKYMNMKRYEKLLIGLFQNVKNGIKDPIRNVIKEDIPAIVQLLNSYSEKNSISRYWDVEEYTQ
jgi:hypothetical protein